MLKKLLSFITLLGGLMTVTAAEIDPQWFQAYQNKGSSYEPRTRHFNPDGQPKYINRLILEDSPYLNQHAHNPVDWYPWGIEAFTAAKQQDKPIFLSIGYSTCHWCHVMEEQSFDNEVIAKQMNTSFINIKVDREQRPELDELYMTAVSLMTGHGGFSMSSFLTPEGKTFWGGTYLPPQQFSKVLNGLSTAWLENRSQVDAQANEIAAAVKKINTTKQQSAQISPDIVEQAASQLLQGYDELMGGFSQAPKFPNEADLFLLLDTIKRNEDQSLLEVVETTLNAMAQGGIYDQVGGGFHRYSTDNEWLVPHFEKMLYNQAHLARVYLYAYELTGNAFYARIARQTLDYVLRDMTSEQGGFYSATDADSEGEEGTFFVWSKDELKSVLSTQDADLVISLFDVTDEGNFEGHNILYLPESLKAYAKQYGLDYQHFLNRLDSILKTLREVRQQREYPLRDNKIITAWNGMMITTLALANDILGDEKYLVAAKQNADFLWKVNRNTQGQLWRVHMQGSSSIPAAQEDYAYLAEAMIALYDASQEKVYLQRAQQLSDAMLDLFWDKDAGGFYMNTVSDVPTMARVKQSSDGATPSGNSIAFHVLSMLSKRTDNLEYDSKASATIAAFADDIMRAPAAYGYMLHVLEKQRNGELSSRQYAARGAVSVKAAISKQAKKRQLVLTLDIQPNWHINANKPLDKDLIATELVLSDIMTQQLGKVLYPQAVEKTLGFSQKRLALYEENIVISTDIELTPEQMTKPIRFNLKLQACNEQVCLAPETLQFRLR